MYSYLLWKFFLFLYISIRIHACAVFSVNLVMCSSFGNLLINWRSLRALARHKSRIILHDMFSFSRYRNVLNRSWLVRYNIRITDFLIFGGINCDDDSIYRFIWIRRCLVVASVRTYYSPYAKYWKSSWDNLNQLCWFRVDCETDVFGSKQFMPPWATNFLISKLKSKQLYWSISLTFRLMKVLVY